MGSLSHLIDPRFLDPLAVTLRAGPNTDLELRAKFMRAVPNRTLSQRSLQILLDLAKQGRLATFACGTWRATTQHPQSAVTRCLEAWCDPALSGDPLFCSRSAVCLDRGLLSAAAEYTDLPSLAARPSLTPTEWARLVSGPCDIRRLTGLASKHSEADFLMLYRSAETPPITDDADVSPRVSRGLLPSLPAQPEDILSGIRSARALWWQQVRSFLGEVQVQDFSSFILYAKEMLDLLFWGAPAPLLSAVSADDLAQVSQTLRRFGLRAEDLATAWRNLPLTYRVISRLSWGVRYLSNNLSHPHPPEIDAASFFRVCNLPPAKQSAIATSRSGHSLLTLIRPLRVVHLALTVWRGRLETIATAKDCAAAITADMHEDKLVRREFADRIRRLNVVPAVHILDALAHQVPPPSFPPFDDTALSSAGLITNLANFFESAQGRAYSEVRLALHAALDFQRRFNRHALLAPQRYNGIWRDTIHQLVVRLEDTRRAFIPSSSSARPLDASWKAS